MTKDTEIEFSDISKIAESKCKTFKGLAEDMERAIGMMYLAKTYGWKVLYLCDSRAYIRKCEAILGVNFKDQFPEETEYSKRSLAFKLVGKVSNFWKAVKGEIPDVRTSEIR